MRDRKTSLSHSQDGQVQRDVAVCTCETVYDHVIARDELEEYSHTKFPAQSEPPSEAIQRFLIHLFKVSQVRDTYEWHVRPPER